MGNDYTAEIGAAWQAVYRVIEAAQRTSWINCACALR